MSLLQKTSDRILNADPHIRYMAISDMSGNAIYTKHRTDEPRILTDEELKDWLKNGTNIWKLYQNLGQKIDDEEVYLISVYKKFRVLTIPFDKDHLLYVTFDKGGGQTDILEHMQAIIGGDYTDDFWTGHYDDDTRFTRDA